MANRDIHRQLMEERGVDIRLPSTALLGVSSVDRYTSLTQRVTNPSTPYDFYIQNRQNFLTGFFTRIALTEFNFTWAIPTINSRCNKIGITDGGVNNAVITVPTGFYTPTTLAAQLQGQVQALGGVWAGFTITANANTGFFTSTSGGVVYNWYRVNANPSRPNAIGLFEMMNWDTTIPPAYIQVSGTPSMIYTPFIDVVCTQLTYNQEVKDADTGMITRDVLARIYLAGEGLNTDPELLGSQPFRVYRQFAFPKQIKWNRGQNIAGSLKFELYDSQGYPIANPDDLINEVADPDWYMSLLVSEV